MDEKTPSQAKRWLIATAKILIVVVVVWYIRRTIADAWDQLGQQPWHFDFVWLTASAALYLFGTLWCGVFWHHVLRILGQPVSLSQSLRAYYVGQLGKYVPGKAMVVVIRAGMVRGCGGDPTVAAACVFYETLTMMAIGALMAAAIVAVCFHQQTLLVWAALAMMAAAGLPTLPPIFLRLVRFVGVGRTDPTIAEKLAGLGYRTMFFGWFLMAINWVVLGFSYWAMLRGIGVGDPNPFVNIHLYTAGIALAMVAGFMSFVPGGAVVREAVLAELMVPLLGDTVAVVGAILLRLVWLVAELLISGILYFIPHR